MVSNLVFSSLFVRRQSPLGFHTSIFDRILSRQLLTNGDNKEEHDSGKASDIPKQFTLDPSVQLPRLPPNFLSLQLSATTRSNNPVFHCQPVSQIKSIEVERQDQRQNQQQQQQQQQQDTMRQPQVFLFILVALAVLSIVDGAANERGTNHLRGPQELDNATIKVSRHLSVPIFCRSVAFPLSVMYATRLPFLDAILGIRNPTMVLFPRSGKVLPALPCPDST